MKKIVYLFTVALLITTTASNSQMLALKANENVETQAASPLQQGGSESITPSGQKVDFKQHPFPPSMLLSKLLGGGFTNGSYGQAPFLHVNTIVLLPSKYESGDAITYNCDNPLINGIIRQGDKIISSRFFYSRELTLPTALLLNCRSGNSIEPPKEGLSAGEYFLEVLLDNRLIFSMPFEMVHMKNSDIYAEDKEFKFMDGYWSKYAYISSTPEGAILFNHYESNTDRKFVANGASKNKQCAFEMQLFHNGQPISKVAKETYYFPRGNWELTKHTIHDIKPPAKALLMADLKDGAYTVKMKMNDEQREYPFTMAGGKPVLIAEQDRAKTTDPAKVFEGMNSEFWVKRTK